MEKLEDMVFLGHRDYRCGDEFDEYALVVTLFTEDSGYETRVYRCFENGTLISPFECDYENYTNEEDAKIGHSKMVHKWATGITMNN